MSPVFVCDKRYDVFIRIVVFAFLCGMCARAESRERYILHHARIMQNGSETWNLWLQDTKRNRTLWKRRVLPFALSQSVHWSKNRRALAIECQSSSSGHRVKSELIVWRIGCRVRFFGVPGGHDFTMGCLWSPDARRLLVRAGGSGAADLDYGELFCLEVGAWPHYKWFDIGGARKMTWRNGRTVVFWELEEVGEGSAVHYGNLKTPRLWRVPSENASRK